MFLIYNSDNYILNWKKCCKKICVFWKELNTKQLLVFTYEKSILHTLYLFAKGYMRHAWHHVSSCFRLQAWWTWERLGISAPGRSILTMYTWAVSVIDTRLDPSGAIPTLWEPTLGRKVYFYLNNTYYQIGLYWTNYKIYTGRFLDAGAIQNPVMLIS